MDSNTLIVVCLSFAFVVNLYVSFCNIKEINQISKEKNMLLKLCIDLMKQHEKLINGEK